MQNAKLLPSEQRVLSLLHLQANLSVAQVAKKTGIREQTIRSYLRKLRERKTIELRPLIDVYRLGFVQWGVFFSLEGGSARSQAELVSFLVGKDNVSFVCELGGEYHFEITVCARGPNEVAAFLEELGARFPTGTIQKSVAARLGLYDFRIKYLLGKEGEPQLLSWGDSPAQIKIDQTDHEILKALSRGTFESKLTLGREIGLSHTAIDNRIKRLEHERIICGYRYLVDTFSLGFQSHLVLFYARGMKANFGERIISFCKDHPNVRFLVRNFGPWEYECGVEVREPQEVSRFTRALAEALSDELGTFRVLPIFGYPKVVNYPFNQLP